MKSKYAIIAIGYNKVNSILRLLNSLNEAVYDDEQITLIVSVDKSDTDKVICAAKEFKWKHGEKQIRTFGEKQGLKKHILSCGDYLEQYDAIFVFEDDIMVSPYFYMYGKQCIEFYGKNDSIAGISLYSPRWNYDANFPFEPLKSKNDVYFMQYAQSWGQIWMKDSWKQFAEWYAQNENYFQSRHEEVPRNLYEWGENSWLKYHIVYCMLHNKFFVYPYCSYTTVFVEGGTHFDSDITRFHSNLMVQPVEKLELADIESKSAVKYNAFFENMALQDCLRKKFGRDVDVDINGVKNYKKKNTYLLSTKILPFKIEKQYAMQLRPVELNILLDIEGKGIFLYDTSQDRKYSKNEEKEQIVRKWDYYMGDRFFTLKEFFPVCKKKLFNLCRQILKK